MSESRRCITSRSMVIDSTARWAACRIVPPGGSYTPRDFIPPAAVLAPDPVQALKKPGWREALAVYRNGDAVPELDLMVRRPIGRLFRRDAQDEHLFRRLLPGVFEDSALEADVKQVPVGAVWSSLGGRHRYAMSLRVGNQIGARSQPPLAPGGDHPDARVDGIVGELEANLIVPFACRAMRHRAGTLLLRDQHLVLGDQWPGHRGAEQVAPLVDRIRLQAGEHEVSDELLPPVFDVDLAGTGLERLLAN